MTGEVEREETKYLMRTGREVDTVRGPETGV